MPAPSTCTEFLDVVRDSGVVDEARLGEFLGRWPEPGSLPADPRELAEEMLRAGLLTTFQKEQLLEGRRRGFLIADKYVLLEHLGAGGMGSVYLCEHRVMRRRVAIKILPTKFAQDPEYLERFRREARAAAALDHPNIVRAYDIDKDAKFHFLVMEYVEGASLHDLVRREGPLEVRRAAGYIAQAAAGLQHAHEAGLVHRDIKPANLLVDRKGTVKILDMGLALFFQEEGEGLTGRYDASAVLGTADYLAPEQAIDSHNVDIRADIYSLGLTFYFLLTGKNPFGEGTIAQKLLWHQMREVKSVREHRPDVPEELAAIVARMIAKDREARYQTPQEVVDALAPWVRGDAEPATAGPDFEVVEQSDPAAPTVSNRDEAATTPATPATTGARKGPAGSSPRPEKTARAPKAVAAPPKTPAKGIKPASEPALKTTVAKGPRPSGKRRRKARDEGFWTPPRLALYGGAAGVCLLLVVGALAWALARPGKAARQGAAPPLDSRVAQAPAPPPSAPPPPKVDAAKGSPAPSAAAPPSPPAASPPSPASGSSPAPKAAEAPKKDRQAEPRKADPAKAEPPKTAAASPKPEPPPAPVRKPQPLTDYFPRPGATLFYDVATFAGGSKAVVRQKWEVKDDTKDKDKGVIDISLVRAGVLDGNSLLHGGTVRWARPLQGKEKLSYRTADGHLEVGQHVRPSGAVVWEPILPLEAAEGDTWKRQLPSGDFQTYTVVKFEQYKGRPAVVIRSSLPVPPDSEAVALHTFAQGVGEVSRAVTLQKKGEKPQLVSEVKLVDE